MSTPRSFPYLPIAIVMVAASVALAHGGQYTNPGQNGAGTPRRGPTGDPRGGGTTPGLEPTWRNWWDRNREDFFNVVERRRLEIEAAAPQSGQGYDVQALHQPATKDDVRNIIVPALLRAVKDKSAEVRDAGAIALGRAGEIPVLENLSPLIGDGSVNVRQAAIMGIGLLRNPMAEQVLVDLLTGADAGFKERGMAALALGLSGGKRAGEYLAKDLGSESPFGRVSRIKYRDVEGDRALGLGLMGKPEGLGPLVSSLRNPTTKDGAFEAMALNGLTRIADDSAVPIALSALGDRRGETRRSAAILAGRCIHGDDAKSVRALVKAIDDEKDLHARYFGLISLGRIGGPIALEYLREVAAKDRNREARCFAVLGLGIARDQASLAFLRKSLTGEKDETLRGASAIALGILGDKDAGETVQTVLESEKNPELRADLITSLAMLGREEAGPTVRKILGDERNRRTVQACGLFLAVTHDSSSIDLMLSILENSGSIQVKGGIATAIGRMGDRRSIEKLVHLFDNGANTDQTRAFAVVALGLIGDKSPISDFARVAIDSNWSLQDQEALIEVIDIF